MPIVQSSPEIRELNVDTFRLALKDLEAGVAGIPWPDTHNHVTETVLSGTTYARIVSILAPYTVEFEDGQYGVRTTGANHNILDVKIANQVSLLTQNSAGMIVTSGGSADWTTTEKNQIRGALGITGTQATPAGGGHLQDVRTPVVANLDAAVTSRAAPGAAMALTTGERDTLSFQIWEEPLGDHTSSIGSAGHEAGHVHDALIVKHGSVLAGSTGGTILTSITGSAGIYTGLTIMIRGATERCARIVRTFDGVTGTFTVTIPFAFTPQAGDSIFVLAQRTSAIFGNAR